MVLTISITVVSLALGGLLYFLYVAGKTESALVQIGVFCCTTVAMFFGSSILAGDIYAFFAYRLVIAIGSGVTSVIGLRKSRKMARSNSNEGKHQPME